jgi:histidine triad (HIT) family protein
MPSLFSKIIAREIPAQIVYENELIMAIHDIAPQAPIHVLLFPKQEITGIAAWPDGGPASALLEGAKHVAELLGVADSGYRLVINQGADGGQTVDHIHVHLLAGRPLAWPPG